MKHIGTGLLLLLAHVQSHGQGRHPKFLELAAHGKYQTGWYTLLDGTRHPGKLRLWQTPTRNLVQVDQGKASPINLLPEELHHFTIGVDSFTVARDVAEAGQPAAKPFGEADVYRVVLRGKLEVLEHDQWVPGQYPHTGPSHYRTWALRPTQDTNIVLLPTENTAFAQHTAAFFVDYPSLAQRIRAGLVGPADFKRIVYSYVFRKEIDLVTYEEAAKLFQ